MHARIATEVRTKTNYDRIFGCHQVVAVIER